MIAPETVAATDTVAARYVVALTPRVAHLIEQADDPIGRQYLPHEAELSLAPHERSDPIGDKVLSPIKGMVGRYADRALLNLSWLARSIAGFASAANRWGRRRPCPV